ncbi:hypothetical protein HMPREF9080_00470 [Cardiobacterium valvarum F0432]|uniref:Uncharacterized protein n=1 Tax=Cardiobacterium valvarum F0432 TaxID=797473 RepID=G9ZCJ4_9GAMM|nr:hypothetical protein HMPREF9080_00470 [Cardiobacterium valvarum F0432]
MPPSWMRRGCGIGIPFGGVRYLYYKGGNKKRRLPAVFSRKNR